MFRASESTTSETRPRGSPAEDIRMRTLDLPRVAHLLLLTLIANIRPAHAQRTVTDAPNLQENITKYALAAQAHITQMAQWQNQVMRTEMQVQSMAQTVEAARDIASGGPLHAIASALSSPMFADSAAGDVGTTLKDGIQLTGATDQTLQYSRDAIGNVLSEAEHGGYGYAAQMHASNQLLGVQAEIEMAQAQQQAAVLAEKQAAAEVQVNQDSATMSTQDTQYMAVRNGAQATDAASSICSGAVQDKWVGRVGKGQGKHRLYNFETWRSCRCAATQNDRTCSIAI